MNKLSKRLEVIASFVPDNKKIIDIGCDHALLSIFLAERCNKNKVIASDINANALNTAIKNVKEAKLEDRIDTRLGNGLEVVNKDEIDTVIISGMGANTIVGILKYAKDKLTNVDDIIIQSNTDLYFIRKNITIMGYYIDNEKLVKDKGIIYTVIRFKRGKKKYNYKELYLGPILLKNSDNLFREKCIKELKTIKMILGNIKEGHFSYKIKLKKNLKILEKMVD